MGFVYSVHWAHTQQHFQRLTNRSGDGCNVNTQWEMQSNTLYAPCMVADKAVLSALPPQINLLSPIEDVSSENPSRSLHKAAHAQTSSKCKHPLLISSYNPEVITLHLWLHDGHATGLISAWIRPSFSHSGGAEKRQRPAFSIIFFFSILRPHMIPIFKYLFLILDSGGKQPIQPFVYSSIEKCWFLASC